MAVLLALLGLRLIALALARTDLFFDEAQYWTWSRDLAFGYFSKPPLIAWTIRAATEVCGQSEACIRAPAPILYSAASVLIYLCARGLTTERNAAAAGIVFATLPGVSFSSGQISTDVPLLFFWSLALLAWARLLATRSLGWAALLGVAIGLGMLAKYAMAYFVLCALVHVACSREARRSIPAGCVLLAAVVAVAILAPHLLWNMQTGFVTVAHTADNADWGGGLFHPGNLLEFFGAQFAVFGPILFAALLAVAWRALRPGASEGERLLLSFSLPVLLLILLQALISRAHANWAAAAYPAASILVTMALLEGGWTRLFRTSLGLHVCAALLVAAAPLYAPQLRLPGGARPFERLLGWRATAAAVRDELQKRPYAAVVTSERQLTAELLYYLRDSAIPVREWRPGPKPRDHYQMTMPFEGSAGPVLFVSLRQENGAVTSRFRSAEPVAIDRVTTGPGGLRQVVLIRLADYTGPNE